MSEPREPEDVRPEPARQTDAPAESATDAAAPVAEQAPAPVADPALLAAVDLAREALLEITPAATVGEPAGHTVEGERVLSLRFHSLMEGYPGWVWTVTLARADDDAEATVLETELMPAAGALLAPDWVPWSERMAEYRAAQEAQAAESADDESDEDDESEDDADHGEDEFDDDGEDADEGFDGIDIDALADDEADDDEADDDEDSDADADADEGAPASGADDADEPEAD